MTAKRLPISVCVISGAEAGRIGKALESVAEWTEEIVVVLNADVVDGTDEAAVRHGARVFREPWKGFVGQRNSASEKASQPWLLALDADEAISPELRREIERLFAVPERMEPFAAFNFPRLTKFCGRWIRHGDWYPDRKERLWRKDKAAWAGGDVHERLEIKGRVGRLRHDLLHCYEAGIDDQLAKIAPYTRVPARGGAASYFDISLRPAWRFARSYFFRLGFLDGWQGCYIAWMAAFCSATRHAKIRAASERIEAGEARVSNLKSQISKEESSPALPRVDVTILIVTRDTRELTTAAVRSAIENEGALTREIVVVDNGSTDGTEAVLPREFPQIRYEHHRQNLGFAKAVNLGARGMNGEFLALLNSDARLKPGALSLAVDWMREHPDCGVAGAQLLYPDGSRQNSIANFPTLATELLNKSLLRRLFPKRFPGKEHRIPAPIAVESVVGAFFLVRRRVWEMLGGLDEGYFFFLEETDFCLQTTRRGFNVFHLPQIEVWHEQGKSAKRSAAGAKIEYWRSRYRYFQKNHGPAVQVILRLGLLVRLCANCFFNLLSMLATAGLSQRQRAAWRVNWALLTWHLRGCPAGMGLPR